jgi:hypothetical protein
LKDRTAVVLLFFAVDFVVVDFLRGIGLGERAKIGILYGF